MARDPKERPEAAELIRRIESSRVSLEGHVIDLKRTLDVPSRVKHSILSRPLAWFGGSLGFGVIASRMIRRRPKSVVKKKGMFAFLITTLLALLKPAIKGMIIAELQRRLKNHPASRNSAKETHLPLSKTPAPPSY